MSKESQVYVELVPGFEYFTGNMDANLNDYREGIETLITNTQRIVQTFPQIKK